ncbi:tyrosine-protein phosphatase [[Bacillus] enclensis]|uniref:tyrosine-protein phosphatase n=1 Tax=[Bacillus] enclensis TaxID=1402860 RepID=UPI0018DB8A1D|nr:CpsB/CapC family capsule biosynthesis tyrosine phosphatase [[Bacillus] enclensis]MBH9967899.1 tyrosine protein phosphatase [[Bacillus] enclensis]
MIDIHSHILPGVDDGAKTMEDTVEMAKAAVSEGIHTIIATPHHMNNSYRNAKSDILPLVDRVNWELKNQQIDLVVLPGQECRIYGEIIEDYLNGEILPLNIHSSYIFVEFPSNSVPRYTDRLFFDLQNEGLIPVIVHPERNAELITHPDRLYNLVKNGAATQITASSLTGHFGKNIQKFSRQLIEANLTHFIASDAHNTSSRAFNMSKALDQIEHTYGIDMVYYFTENAELLVEGKNIYREIPEKVKKRKFLGIF